MSPQPKPLAQPSTRRRLDQVMVERGLVPSRARARDLILRGEVSVAGLRPAKQGALVGPDAVIEVSQGAAAMLSRGCVKLTAGLEAFGFEPRRGVVLDVGASTGGFTQVLLERGAARVFAIDVGHGQLHPSLVGDPRVVGLEGVDARVIDAGLIGGSVDAIVADVSFISLTLALPAALALAAPGAWLVALVKPQFELERGAIGKGGIVRDEAGRARALARVTDWLGQQRGWKVVGVEPSPITGAGGNQEFILGAICESPA